MQGRYVVFEKADVGGDGGVECPYVAGRSGGGGGRGRRWERGRGRGEKGEEKRGGGGERGFNELTWLTAHKFSSNIHIYSYNPFYLVDYKVPHVVDCFN